MLGERYMGVVRRILDAVETEELPKVAAVAERAAASVAAGGAFYVYDNGHMLNTELFNRAGGLVLLAGVPVTRRAPGPDGRRFGGGPLAEPDAEAERMEDLSLARMAVRQAGVRADDVVMLGSVSGRSPLVVELALAAKRRGAYTVALTARAYAEILPPLHPSGQLLYQAADMVLDTHTAVGDAELTVEGLPEKLLPSSGISAAVVAWCLIGELVEQLLARGIVPTVLRSINYPDGPERYAEAMARYRERGV